jgi:hypothetical protein
LCTGEECYSRPNNRLLGGSNNAEFEHLGELEAVFETVFRLGKKELDEFLSRKSQK